MIKISADDLHEHMKKRMKQRGITIDEVEHTLNFGWDAKNAKEGTFGKKFVFEYNKEWEGKIFKEKEISVYYKIEDFKIILLTAIVRYGENFERG